MITNHFILASKSRMISVLLLNNYFYISINLHDISRFTLEGKLWKKKASIMKNELDNDDLNQNL